METDLNTCEKNNDIILTSKISLFLKFIGLLVFAMVCNSILSTFIILMIQGWGVLTVVIIPVAVIGVCTATVAFYQFLILCTPHAAVIIRNFKSQKNNCMPICDQNDSFKNRAERS